MAQDQALIERIRDGDRSAFAAVIEQHQSAVFGYLRARLSQASDAEDMTQEVFLRFYVGRARFDAANLIRPWLLGIARNLLREHTRKVRREETLWTQLCLELEDLVHSSDSLLDDVLGRLPVCLDGLGPSARQAIELHYRSNLRLAEIGQQLRRSEGAVKLLMHRARQALRDCLGARQRSETR